MEAGPLIHTQKKTHSNNIDFSQNTKLSLEFCSLLVSFFPFVLNMFIHSIMKIMYVCPPPKKIRIVLNKKMKVPPPIKILSLSHVLRYSFAFFSHFFFCPAPPVLLIPLCCLSVQILFVGSVACGVGGTPTAGSLHHWFPLVALEGHCPPLNVGPLLGDLMQVSRLHPVRKPNNSDHCQESVQMLLASSEDIPREHCGPLINVRAPRSPLFLRFLRFYSV